MNGVILNSMINTTLNIQGRHHMWFNFFQKLNFRPLAEVWTLSSWMPAKENPWHGGPPKTTYWPATSSQLMRAWSTITGSTRPPIEERRKRGNRNRTWTGWGMWEKIHDKRKGQFFLGQVDQEEFWDRSSAMPGVQSFDENHSFHHRLSGSEKEFSNTSERKRSDLCHSCMMKL